MQFGKRVAAPAACPLLCRPRFHTEPGPCCIVHVRAKKKHPKSVDRSKVVKTDRQIDGR